MGKKGVTMSLFEANSKFGGDAASQMLPSQSEGKDFGKSKGKGLRDNTGDLDDWRTPGERKGKGRGKGDERSRADDGDWFSKDRPAGGGGDRGGGDRGGGGGGGFRRDGDRGRDDNTQANKDDDWRSGMGSRGGGGGGDDDRGGGRGGFGNRDRDGGGGRGGFGNRDRDGGGGRDDDQSSWRRDKQESSGPSERPKLNLKPKSGGADATPTGGGDKPSRPWDKKDDQEDDDATPAADEKKPTKYVPPGQRKAMEEEEKKKDQRKKEEDERRAKNQEKMQKEEEEKNRRRSEAQRKQDEIAEKRRKELEEVEEKKRRIEEEKQAAERARKNALKLEKEAEAKEKREAVMRASQEKKNAAKGGAEVKVECNTEKVESFGEKCEALVKGSGNVDTFVKKEVDDILTPDELGTVQPMARLLEVLLTYCRGKKDKEVIDVVAKFAPLLNCLISSSGVRRFKVKVLIEAQRIASKMGLPRLSPASALLEIFFDGLYSAEVIEEAYFEMWAVSNDDTPGKTSAMFQVNFFLDWLRKAKLDGEESSEEEEEDKEGSEEEDEDDDEEVDDDDDDIMANVPRGRGR